VASYGDEDLTAFLPYYHQSATELGYPISDESYLQGLMFPGQDTARAYIPANIPTPAYDEGAAMHDVQDWIAASGERIMLIYGQNDPWTAGKVELGGAADSFRYIAPGGNHGSSIISLAADDEAEAIATIQRWADVPAMFSARMYSGERTLEQEEFELRRRR
jgi:hypothetical protein